MNVLVSVYMPTRNRATLLRRAVESVLSQSYRALELIVVDDGSTDETAAYLKDAQASDERLHVIHNPSSLGAPQSRNLAIEMSRGEFITGLDDDDHFHPQRIEGLVNHWCVLRREGDRFSCLYTQDLLVHGKRIDLTSKPDRVEFSDLFFYNLIGNQVFTRREYLIEAGMFDVEMPAWQDLDTFIRLVRQFGTARLLDQPLYVVDLDPRPDRISTGSKERILAAYRRLAAKSVGVPEACKQALYLQVFGRLYGFRLGLNDLREYLRYGVHARTLRILGGVLLRQLVHSR
jgi:glycosyltransferase involved in cell wall biosynthesis